MEELALSLCRFGGRLAACGEGILFERGCVRHRSILNYELLFTVGAGARKPPPRALAKAMSSTKPLRRSDVDCSRAARSASSTIRTRSEEHTSELHSLMRISYADFC